MALVGEAAHVFPPIGAQGLNLGIRDVDDLVEIACENREDPGAPAGPCPPTIGKRRPDILARSGAVNLLNMSLLSDLLPAQMARSAGLSVLGGFAPLRAFFMREGLRPGSGFSALGLCSGRVSSRQSGCGIRATCLALTHRIRQWYVDCTVTAKSLFRTSLTRD